MIRVITITSGKGGVGKTSLTTNLGVALGQLGKRVVMIDLDIQMANLGLMVGMEERPIAVQDVLLEEAGPLDATYDLHPTVKVMPARLSAGRPEKISSDKLAKIIKELEQKLKPDFILIDTAPGMGKDITAPLDVSTDAIIITMPETISIADSMKMVMLVEKRKNVSVIGTVINMVKGLREEMTTGEIQETLGTEILGVIPEDPDLRRCSLRGTPVIDEVPNAPSSIAIMSIASKLTGVAPPTRPRERNKSIIDIIKEFIAKLTQKKSKLPSMGDLSKPK